MIQVKPLTVSIVNWKDFQHVNPCSNCIQELKRLGANERDPAALPLFLTKFNDIQYTCKFCFLQFLVATVNKPFKSIGALDLFEMPVEDHEIGMIRSYILSGTGDKWRQQVLAECRKENDPTRRIVFNACFDYINRTGLKSMFDGVVKVKVADGFILR